jgi:hypothetical protein
MAATDAEIMQMDSIQYGGSTQEQLHLKISATLQ